MDTDQNRARPLVASAASGIQETMFSAKSVRARYGDASEMTIWRWLRKEGLGFPHPIRINNRRYWRKSDLEAWEISLATRKSGAAE